MAHSVGPMPARGQKRSFPYAMHHPAPHVLLVNGARLHVDMRYLADESCSLRNYFGRPDLWAGPNQFTVDLSACDGDVNAFVDMMNVIPPLNRPLNVENVRPILSIAREFYMLRLFKRCLDFLGSDSANAIPALDLVQIAFEYEHEPLKWRACERLFSEKIVGKRLTGRGRKEYFRKHLTVRSEKEIRERCAPLAKSGDAKVREWLLNKMITRPGTEARRKKLCNDKCFFDSDGVCVVCEYLKPGARNPWSDHEEKRRTECLRKCTAFDVADRCVACKRPRATPDGPTPERKVKCQSCVCFDLKGACRECYHLRSKPLTFVTRMQTVDRWIMCGNRCDSFTIDGVCTRCQVQGPWV